MRSSAANCRMIFYRRPEFGIMVVGILHKRRDALMHV